MLKKDRHLYEMIPETLPKRFFLDLDIKTPADAHNMAIETIVDHFSVVSDSTLKDFGISIKYISCSISSNPRVDKVGIHLIFETSHFFGSMKEMGTIARRIHHSIDDRLKTIMDVTVYTHERLFRMANQSKLKDYKNGINRIQNFERFDDPHNLVGIYSFQSVPVMAIPTGQPIISILDPTNHTVPGRIDLSDIQVDITNQRIEPVTCVEEALLSIPNSTSFVQPNHIWIGILCSYVKNKGNKTIFEKWNFPPGSNEWKRWWSWAENKRANGTLKHSIKFIFRVAEYCNPQLKRTKSEICIQEVMEFNLRGIPTHTFDQKYCSAVVHGVFPF